jgi:quercetin dioxygenase-like cupin family protein
MMDYTLISNVGAAVSEIPPDSIVSRTIYQAKGLRVILFGFAPGQELSEHTSTKEAILHFLSGEAEVTLGGDTASAQAGTLIRMAPNLQHSVRAASETRMLLYMVG